MRVSTSALIRAKSRESPDPRQNKARRRTALGLCEGAREAWGSATSRREDK